MSTLPRKLKIMMRKWIGLLFFAAGGMAQAAPTLSCQASGVEVCAGGDRSFAAISDDEFDRAFDVRQEKFVTWMKPFAFFVQGWTGLPMTVTIAQAALSSEWGTSTAFKKHKNIFKLTCWQPKTVLSGEVQIGPHKFSYKATCSADKAAGQVGKWMSFATREESFFAYLDMILESHAQTYKPLQDHLQHALKTIPPRPPSYRGVTPMMAAFSHDGSYIGSLKRAIELNKIPENEAAQCWACLRGTREASK